ncbi:MAG: aminotransferase class I/II-fold pyridoxal phosphate-dependent enzyme [Chitinivibrionales bacterium]|nr:aminotransferase class I/II-fold pyridoxal phosphate-dependent enzyme [Chitinivibrionales bacterium]
MVHCDAGLGDALRANRRSYLCWGHRDAPMPNPVRRGARRGGWTHLTTSTAEGNTNVRCDFPHARVRRGSVMTIDMHNDAPLLEPIPLSSYGQSSLAPSPVNRMMTAFASDFREGIDINLGVGYVNEQTMPREALKDALEHVLADPNGHRNALNYGGAQGSPNLIRSIRRYYVERGFGGVTAEMLDRYEVVIGPSGATSLLQGLAQLIEPGIVITSDPLYYIYCEYLERAGFEIVAIPEDEEGIRTDLLEHKLAALGARRGDVRFLYVATVGNPTSTILAEERRERLVHIAHELSRDLGRRVPVVFDAAYEALIHDPAVKAPRSGLVFDRQGLVYEIGSLSKTLAPALRIGYLVGRKDRFLDALVQNVSDTGFSAPLITQEIASHLLDSDLWRQVDFVNRGYRERADAVGGWIREYLGEHLESLTGGQAGFYFYLTFKKTRTTEDSAFFRFLSRTSGDRAVDGPPEGRLPRVSFIPGEHCVHPRGDLVEVGKRQLRISYAYESLPNIRRGLELMREAVLYDCGVQVSG